MRNALLVALGGAVGSMLRYATNVLLATASTGFPWATLTVNVAGSFVLGLLVARFPVASSTPRLLVGTGVCGGFTTFSTFSAETLALAERGEPGRAGAYVAVSVAAGLAAAYAGLAVGRAVAR